MNTVYLAVEGSTDVPVAERLVRLVGQDPFTRVVSDGKSELDKKIAALRRSGAHQDWLVLRDLDHDAPCPAQLVRKLGGGRPFPQRVSVRVPVREIDSWLLADAEGFSRVFSVGKNRLPARPDDLDDPKQQLVHICRKSKQQAIRETMPPLPGSGREVGTGYASRISDFARNGWDPERAAKRSPSLARSLVTLRRLVREGIWGGGPSLPN